MNDYYFDRNEAVEEMFFDAWERYEDLKDDEDDEDHGLTPAERNPSMLR